MLMGNNEVSELKIKLILHNECSALKNDPDYTVIPNLLKNLKE
jgi:hypothetical protein